MPESVMNRSSDKTLVVEELVEQHADYLYNYALGRLKDPNAAEEVLQETMLAAVAGKESFAGRSSVRTWLVSILRFKIIDVFRRRSKENAESFEDLGEDKINACYTESGHMNFSVAEWGAEDPERALEHKGLQEALGHCVGALSQKLRDVFTMRVMLEQTTEDVRNELGLSSTNVGVILFRARSQIRECLEKTWFEADKGSSA